MRRGLRAFHSGGFTLLEAVLVIALTGIVAAMVAGFIKAPITAYVDQARRAELSDAADTALRRIAREVQRALPNSVRVDASGTLLEFLPVSAAGRYRAAPDASGAGDFLDFDSATDGSFAVLGPAVSVSAGDQLVVYNLGLPGADAYSGESRRALVSTGAALSTLAYTVGGTQPLPGGFHAGHLRLHARRRRHRLAATLRRLRHPGGTADRHRCRAAVHARRQQQRAACRQRGIVQLRLQRAGLGAQRPADAHAQAQRERRERDPAAAGPPGQLAMSAPVSQGMRPAQGGFAIISAVFLIVILSLLGAMIVSLSTTQQVGAARDLLGSRAYFAARAGIEWGAYQVLQGGTCSASSTLPALSGSAAGFTVTVACSRTGPFDEAGTSVYVHQLTSTASAGTLGALDYAERQLQAVVSTP
jgi:type II secretory pathway pseudopilin PulG